LKDAIIWWFAQRALKTF